MRNFLPIIVNLMSRAGGGESSVTVGLWNVTPDPHERRIPAQDVDDILELRSQPPE